MDDKEKLEREKEKLRKEKEELERAKKNLAKEKEQLKQEKEEMEERQIEQEEVIAYLEKTEFNNFEEDKTIIKSEKQKEIFEKNKPLIIGGIILLIIILLGAILLFKDSVKKKPKESSYPNQEESTPASDNQPYYVSNDSMLLFNKYLYHDNSKTLTNLLGHKLTQLDKNYEMKIGKDFIYEFSHLNTERNIKRFNGEKFIKVLEKKYDTETDSAKTGTITNIHNVFLGMYDNSRNSSTLYLLNQETYKTITLPSLEAYTFNTTSGDSVMIYEDQYLMTHKNGLIGLYDIKNEKELLKPVYSDLVSINDSEFIAVQNEKSGIIDASGKILLDFKYSMLEKAGKYYVAGKENRIVVLNDNYQEIESATLSVPNLNKYNYQICCGNANPLVVKNVNNHLIVGVGATGYETVTYYYLDQNNQFIKLVSGTIKTIGAYLLAQEKGSTNISVYDKNMTRIQGFDLQDSLENRNMSLFLGDYLVATKKDAEPRFFVISTGETKKVINSFMRDHKEYRVTFTFTDRSKNLGTITVQQESQELARLENASFISYISAENNGVHFIDNKLVYYAGRDILVLK